MPENYNHGVQYSPFTVSEPKITIQTLQDHSIQYIRLQWVDLLNNIRYRVIPTSYFLKVLDSPRPSISITKAVFGLVFIALADGFRFVPIAPGFNKSFLTVEQRHWGVFVRPGPVLLQDVSLFPGTCQRHGLVRGEGPNSWTGRKSDTQSRFVSPNTPPSRS